MWQQSGMTRRLCVSPDQVCTPIISVVSVDVPTYSPSIAMPLSSEGTSMQRWLASNVAGRSTAVETPSASSSGLQSEHEFKFVTLVVENSTKSRIPVDVSQCAVQRSSDGFLLVRIARNIVENSFSLSPAPIHSESKDLSVDFVITNPPGKPPGYYCDKCSDPRHNNRPRGKFWVEKGAGENVVGLPPSAQKSKIVKRVSFFLGFFVIA